MGDRLQQVGLVSAVSRLGSQPTVKKGRIHTILCMPVGVVEPPFRTVRARGIALRRGFLFQR
jgi:hypothetical protein